MASRIGLVRRVVGTPEVCQVDDLLALSRCLLSEGVRFVHLLLHSPSLVPGLSPFVTSAVDRERLYTTIERYVEGLAKMASIRPATVSEAAEALCSATVSDARLSTTGARQAGRGPNVERNARGSHAPCRDHLRDGQQFLLAPHRSMPPSIAPSDADVSPPSSRRGHSS